MEKLTLRLFDQDGLSDAHEARLPANPYGDSGEVVPQSLRAGVGRRGVVHGSHALREPGLSRGARRTPRPPAPAGCRAAARA
jgi:hypothetical protein